MRQKVTEFTTCHPGPARATNACQLKHVQSWRSSTFAVASERREIRRYLEEPMRGCGLKSIIYISMIVLFLGLMLSFVTGQDKKLNIIAFGAHPDDCDGRAGGTAAKWA